MAELTKRFIVSGVCCSTEERVLRKKLDKWIGAQTYTFNPVTCELCVRGHLEGAQVVAKVREAGFDARARQHQAERPSFWQKHAVGVQAGAATSLTLLGMLLEHFTGSAAIAHGVLAIAMLTGGWKIALKAMKAARMGSLDMNVLMSAAVLGAIALGKWSEGAAVIVLFSVSLMLESYSSSRTRREVRSLLELSPEQACVIRNGREDLVPADSVVPEELIRIRPGQRVPLDGVVVEGESTVSEAAITGEAVPLMKTAGTSVVAGSMNHRGSLLVRVSKRFEETALARIVHLVEDAQQERAPVQRFIDRFAVLYTPVVLGMAVLLAVLPPLLLQLRFDQWLYRSLVLLVIACPCALVISTPVTMVSALASAARRGILIKGARHIETLSKVKAMAFDKTGTLTEGKPRITDVVSLNLLPREDLLQIIAAIELYSEHHLASAVLAVVPDSAINPLYRTVSGFEALPGLGVKAIVAGTTYYLGNHQLCEDLGFCSPLVEQTLERFAHEGKTTVVLGNEHEVLCVLAMKDTTRNQSKTAIEQLRQLGLEYLGMLSGDHEMAVEQLAAEVGLRHSSAGLLPDHKVSEVRKLQSRYGSVAMVGDGINDAPALAASSIGIAMGVSGTDTALETADVVLTSDDLMKLPALIRLSRKAMRLVRQNIALAIVLKVVFLVLSFSGVATLWMAVLADDGAALVVIFNGLRILSLREDL